MNLPLAILTVFFTAFLAVNAFSWKDAEAVEMTTKQAPHLKVEAQTTVITGLSASEMTQSELPDWRRYFVSSAGSAETPIIALVFDDRGHNEEEFVGVMALGEGITLAILPYTNRAAEFAQRARQQGFEILVHMPMEANDSSADPGSNALLTNLSDKEFTSPKQADAPCIPGCIS